MCRTEHCQVRTSSTVLLFLTSCPSMPSVAAVEKTVIRGTLLVSASPHQPLSRGFSPTHGLGCWVEHATGLYPCLDHPGGEGLVERGGRWGRLWAPTTNGALTRCCRSFFCCPFTPRSNLLLFLCLDSDLSTPRCCDCLSPSSTWRLTDGTLANRFSHECQLPSGLSIDSRIGRHQQSTLPCLHYLVLRIVAHNHYTTRTDLRPLLNSLKQPFTPVMRAAVRH